MPNLLDKTAAELHAKMLTLKVGGVCLAGNIRVRRSASGTFEYTKDGMKTTGSATGIASMVTLLTQKKRMDSNEDAVSRERIVAYCESLKDGVNEKRGRKTNSDFAIIGTCDVIGEFVKTLLPLEGTHV